MHRSLKASYGVEVAESTRHDPKATRYHSETMKRGRAVEGVEARTARSCSLTGIEWRSIRWTVGLALASGLLLRLWYMFHYPRVTGDALVYSDIARNLLQHHVYGFSETLNGLPVAPHPTLIRLPGYPFFLTLCFRLFGVDRYPAVLLLQIVIDLWTCLLLAGIAARIFGQRAGIAALWLSTLCPFTANYTAAALTETLTLFCIALAFYSLTRWQQAGSTANRWVPALGFALAYAILVRPEQGLLAVAVLPAMFWLGTRAHGPRGAWPVLLVAALTFAPLVPWAARNWQTFHVIQPLAPRFANDPGESNPYGFQRWYRTWAIEFASTENVYWNYDASPINPHDLPTRAFDSQAQMEETQALLANYNENTSATPELDQRFDAIAGQRIRANPFRSMALPVARALNMMLRPRTEMLPVPVEWWKFRVKPAACAFAAVYASLNLAYFILAGVVLRRSWLWRAHAALVWSMVATIALRAALLLTLDNSEARYTLEFFPVLIVLGAGLWAKSPPASTTNHNATYRKPSP